MKPSGWEGKVVLITGAGSGIGFEFARQLHWLGVRIVAELGIRALTRGSDLAIPGWLNRLHRLAAFWLPQSWLSRIAG